MDLAKELRALSFQDVATGDRLVKDEYKDEQGDPADSAVILNGDNNKQTVNVHQQSKNEDDLPDNDEIVEANAVVVDLARLLGSSNIVATLNKMSAVELR